jgi:nucleoside-diphosphate-sugar epimerase
VHILILGGKGYVGSRLEEELGRFHEVESLDWENRNIHLDFNSFEVIINLAAHSSVALCDAFPDLAQENNVVRLDKIIGRLNSKTFLIHISSGSVYGNLLGQADEEQQLQKALNIYDRTKIDGDSLVLKAINEGKRIISLRFGTVCGISPNTRVDLVLNAMVLRAIEHKEILVFGGNTRRGILLLGDLCEAMERIVELQPCGIFNLSSLNTTVDNLASSVALRLGVKILKIDESNSSYNFELNPTKLLSQIGNFRVSSLNETIDSLREGLSSVKLSRANLQGPHNMLGMWLS